MLLSLWKTYSRSKLKILLREESYVLIRTFSKRNMIRRKLAQILKIGVTVVFNYGVSRFLHHVSSENLRVSIFTWWWWTLDVFVLLSAFFYSKGKTSSNLACVSAFFTNEIFVVTGALIGSWRKYRNMIGDLGWLTVRSELVVSKPKEKKMMYIKSVRLFVARSFTTY